MNQVFKLLHQLSHCYYSEKLKMKAAIYLRSSKDRSDVSISAQRKELQHLAVQKNLDIIEEYADEVESAKDENRPAFQKLISDLKGPSRKWNHLLFVDTSRLSRRRYAAQIFKHECRKRNVTILYSKMPETDPINTVVLEAVFEAMDEVHSLMSREKGIAGMKENIALGYRAGGRAPKGYKLKYFDMGTVRDGAQLTKSKLEPSKDAAMISRYLKERANGRARAALCRELNIKISSSTLTGIEWNALTYAGHTVWNVHNEFKNGYTGRVKRRPRSDWVITKNTHKALITNEEAEILLARLEQKNSTRARRSTYLLSGLLKTPENLAWHSNGEGCYRTKGKKIKMEEIEEAVLGKIYSDMQSPKFTAQLASEIKNYTRKHENDPAKTIRRDINNINTKIDKLMSFALELEDRGPAIREINKLESERKNLNDELIRMEKDHQASIALSKIQQPDVSKILKHFVNEIKALDKEPLKDRLHSLIRRVTLSPDTLECSIEYSIGIRGDVMASPRGFEPLLPP